MKTIDLNKNVILSEIYNTMSINTLFELHAATGDSFTVNNGKITEVDINETKAL